MENPFSVKTPESLSPQMLVDLFVDVYGDFESLLDNQHTFLHGARGTGKSMMLRYLEPKVQMLADDIDKINKVAYYAVHVPIKKSILGGNAREFNRLVNSSHFAFSEHIMVISVLSSIIHSLKDIFDHNNNSFNDIYDKTLYLLKLSGWTEESSICFRLDNYDDMPPLIKLENLFDEEIHKVTSYLRKLSFQKNPIPYNGLLCGYLDFLIPIVESIVKLDCTPNGPLYLMMDDADNLTVSMQKILNTWVSCRTTDFLCLKISTQLRYKTYRTVTGQLIESPHDYSEIDIGTVYTSKKDNYINKVEEIVRRRLKLAKIDTEPYDYFPLNQKQENGITKIKKELKDRWEEGKGYGYRASDDVVRYARPEYIRRLGGKGKSRATYSFAGFRNMVDISSGIIRSFLQPATLMYSEAKSQNINKITSIPHTIQDKVLKKWSEDFIVIEFDKIKATEATESDEDKSKASKLYSLVNGLGELFQTFLLNEEARQRRIFSVMVTKALSPEIDEIIALGIEWGYFQKTSISSKEGIGRNVEIILNRRLAPYFKLDPSGYAVHLSVTNEDLELACLDHKAFVRKRSGQEKEGSQPQTEMFKDH